MNAHGKTAKANVAAMPVIKLVTNVKDIDKRTTTAVGSLKTQQHELHVLAVSVLIHVAKHGNIDVLTNFLDKCKDVAMIRNNALGNWFERFGTVYYEEDKTKGKGWKLHAVKCKAFREGTENTKALVVQRQYLDDASKTPFWMLKGNEGGEYVKFDTHKAIDNLIKSLNLDMKKAKDAGVEGVDHSKLITELKLAKVRAKDPLVEEFDH